MLTFDIVDVFSDRPFAGNQLAVVHGAEELSTEQCAANAREFNYSETAFPSPSTGAEYATRIFTPSAEIPFAGHPTLGTAWVLRLRGLLTADTVTQHCGAGEIGVSFLPDGNVELTAAARDLAGPVDDDLVAALLEDVGLSISDADGPARLAGTGLTFVHLPVTEDALARARPSSRPLREYAERLAAVGATRDPVGGINLHHVSGSALASRVVLCEYDPLFEEPDMLCAPLRALVLPLAVLAAAAWRRTPLRDRPPPVWGWRWSPRESCPRAAATRSRRAWRWAARRGSSVGRR